MTYLALILTTTLLAAIWLAVDLIRPNVRAFGRAETRRGRASPRSYKPVGRLLKDGDFAYLADEQDLAERLRQTRNKTLRLYLQQLRHDYVETWRVCKLLAPISADPAFAAELSKQYWRFHCAYAGIQVQCLLPALGVDSAPADALVRTLSEVRQQARALLEASEGSLSAVPSAA